MSWIGLIAVVLSGLGAIVSVSFAVKNYRDSKAATKAAKEAKEADELSQITAKYYY